jgi:hypothetical protein
MSKWLIAVLVASLMSSVVRADCEWDLSVCVSYADELELQNAALRAANNILVEQRDGAYKRVSELEVEPLLPGWARLIVGGAAGCVIGGLMKNTEAGAAAGLTGGLITIILE